MLAIFYKKLDIKHIKNHDIDMYNDTDLWEKIQDYFYDTLYYDLKYKNKIIPTKNQLLNIIKLSNISLSLLN